MFSPDQITKAGRKSLGESQKVIKKLLGGSLSNWANRRTISLVAHCALHMRLSVNYAG